VTVTDNASGTVLLGSLGYTCVQPQLNNYWCVSGACDFDGYQPNLPNLALIQTGPQGSAGPACATGSGVCTMTVPIVLPGDPTLPTEAATMNFVNESAGLNVTTVFGSDIGAKINNAVTACAATCELRVPAGTYNYSTTISLPLNTFGTYKLTLDPGAVLVYQGSGDAILTRIPTNPTVVNLIIEGGTLLGNPNAKSGIHIMPSQHVTIRNMTILQFTGGDAILNEGANVTNIYDNNLQINLNGLHQISTFCNAATPVVCSTSFTSGQAYSPNANHVHDNTITNNSHWGIFEEWNGLAGSTGALNNDFRDNNLEIMEPEVLPLVPFI